MPITCGKVRKPSIMQHPGAPGMPLASLVYRSVKLPGPAAGERLILSFFVGFKDGVKAVPSFNGCEFIVQIDKTEVFRQVHDQERWQPCQVDLGSIGGRSVEIRFLMDPRHDSSADSAAWANPGLCSRAGKAPGQPRASLTSGLWPTS